MFWLEKPTLLWTTPELVPISDSRLSDQLNAVSRLVILFTLVVYLIRRQNRVLITGGLTLAVIAVVYYLWRYTKKGPEGFSNRGEFEGEHDPASAFGNRNVYNSVRSNFTNPTPTNPLMNVLLPEISDNPHRQMAAPAFNPVVEADINAATQTMVVNNFGLGETDSHELNNKLFRDLGDQFTFDRSMRQFNVMPNTKVPNDQDLFAQFCYGDMIACRDPDDMSSALGCTRNMPYRWTS